MATCTSRGSESTFLQRVRILPYHEVVHHLPRKLPETEVCQRNGGLKPRMTVLSCVVTLVPLLLGLPTPGGPKVGD